MKRVFFGCVIALLLFVVGFFALNLFDSAPESSPGVPAPVVTAGDGPLAANLDPGNGFFIVWGFAEPPATDPLARGYRRQVQDLFADRSRTRFNRSPYGRWLARLNIGYARHWQGLNVYFPQAHHEDPRAYFAARRAQVAAWQRRFAPLLRRYQLLLQAGLLEDFTPLGRECPARSLTLATQTAKLHAALQLLAAADGHWPEAGSGLLQALATGLRMIASGRTIKVNSLGRTMVESSLRALASLLNRPECPPGFARLIRENLSATASVRFGTASVRASHWLGFRAAINRVKVEKIVDPLLLKDYFRAPAAFYALDRFVALSGPRVFTVVHALAVNFIKENETVSLLRASWERFGRLEEIPPWRWGREPKPSSRRTPFLAGDAPFWWLRNPLGKMMARSAMPFSWPILRHYVYRTHELKARYDLVRLLVQARLAAGAGNELEQAALLRLLAAAAERDPFSGAPYRFSPQQGVIYSIGSDRDDDGGREGTELWRDSDIAVPIMFVIRDS
jgi:hypothetical protein